MDAVVTAPNIEPGIAARANVTPVLYSIFFGAGVDYRSGKRIEENHDQRNTGDRSRRFIGIKQQQDGHQDKTSARSDEGAKGANDETKRQKPKSVMQ